MSTTRTGNPICWSSVARITDRGQVPWPRGPRYCVTRAGSTCSSRCPRRNGRAPRRSAASPATSRVTVAFATRVERTNPTMDEAPIIFAVRCATCRDGWCGRCGPAVRHRGNGWVSPSPDPSCWSPRWAPTSRGKSCASRRCGDAAPLGIDGSRSTRCWWHRRIDQVDRRSVSLRRGRSGPRPRPRSRRFGSARSRRCPL